MLDKRKLSKVMSPDVTRKKNAKIQSLYGADAQALAQTMQYKKLEHIPENLWNSRKSRKRTLKLLQSDSTAVSSLLEKQRLMIEQ